MISLVLLYHWLDTADPAAIDFVVANQPESKRCPGTSMGTMEPADTCIGWATRGRQAPHAL